MGPGLTPFARSFNHQNIGASVESGLWATQAHNERVLGAALAAGVEVVLVFRRALFVFSSFPFYSFFSF